MAALTIHEMGRTTFGKLRNRYECHVKCTCGVAFSRWGDDKIEANAKAKTAINDHLEAIRKARLS